ncbi:MAG: dicarboxylate/amino acid:cation symporter [Longimicrobiales bacterium]
MTLGTRTLLALAAGVALGSLAAGLDIGPLKGFATLIEPVGTLWVNAIRMTVIPLMIAMIVRGIATQRDASTTGRLSARTLFWFIVLIAGTTTFAALVAPPLLNFMPERAADAAALVPTSPRPDLPPFRDWLIALIPTNPIKAAADGAILPLAVFSIVFGLALARVKIDVREPLLQMLGAVVEALFAVVEWVLWLAPIGVFALSLSLVVRTGTSAAGMFGFFIVLSSALCVIAMLALYPLTAWLARVPIRTFARACATPQAVAFPSRSSLASLPAMMKSAESVLQLPEHVTGLVLPLAVSVFKYASPIVRIVGTLFVARLYGIELDVAETAGIAFGIGALSFYSPGIPSGGLLVITPLYESLGLPIEGIGLLIALDAIPDMFLTTANVTGDMSVAALVAHSEPVASGARELPHLDAVLR